MVRRLKHKTISLFHNYCVMMNKDAIGNCHQSIGKESAFASFEDEEEAGSEADEGRGRGERTLCDGQSKSSGKDAGRGGSHHPAKMLGRMSEKRVRQTSLHAATMSSVYGQV